MNGWEWPTLPDEPGYSVSRGYAGKWQVSSATDWSSHEVEQVFRNAVDARGGMSEKYFRQEFRVAPDEPVFATIAGSVTLRENVEWLSEQIYPSRRQHGRLDGVSRRFAHAFVEKHITNGTISTSPHGIPYATISTLEQLLKQK